MVINRRKSDELILKYWPVCTTVISMILVILGIIIGYYQNAAGMADRFVLKERYLCDQKKSDLVQERMERKINAIYSFLLNKPVNSVDDLQKKVDKEEESLIH